MTRLYITSKPFTLAFLVSDLSWASVARDFVDDLEDTGTPKRYSSRASYMYVHTCAHQPRHKNITFTYAHDDKMSTFLFRDNPVMKL